MTYRDERFSRDLIHCSTTQKADIRFHDGALPHLRGACCNQVARAARDLSLSPEGLGHTYNHAPMLAYFEGHFLYEYLSGPRGEHEAPSQVWLCASPDGIHWDKPRLAFPAITALASAYRVPRRDLVKDEELPCIVHHRMGFYRAQNGCLLMSTFYGFSPDFHLAPNNGWGLGRVVREVRLDLSLSDIYFLRYNEPGGYTRENAKQFPLYSDSNDPRFVAACGELLANPLAVSQWWEEQRFDSLLKDAPAASALSPYTLDNGRVMGVFKNSHVSYSDDGGKSWTEPEVSASIETSTGKVWGQRLPGYGYALVYNPSPDAAHRWPLALASGTDGAHFSGLSAIVPEISPSRYAGKLKNLGAQYVRGICEYNGLPDDQAMWLCYSVNKEDMWVARVPVPPVNRENEPVHDDMAKMTQTALRDTWNLYVPNWNAAELMTDARGRQVLSLMDRDPYDRTRAMRLVQSGELVRVKTVICIQSLALHTATLQLQDSRGQVLCLLLFKPDGVVYLNTSGNDEQLIPWRSGAPLSLDILCDCVENSLQVQAECAGESNAMKARTAASAEMVDRVLFATKQSLPWQGLAHSGKLGDLGDLPGADLPHEATVIDIHLLQARAFSQKE